MAFFNAKLAQGYNLWIISFYFTLINIDYILSSREKEWEIRMYYNSKFIKLVHKGFQINLRKMNFTRCMLI